jgi:recombinational DNA repair protein RecT
MAKKTALRRLCKILPTSPELSKAVALDEQAEASVPQQLDVLAEDVEIPIDAIDVESNGAGEKLVTSAS